MKTVSATKPCKRDEKKELRPRIHSMKEHTDGKGKKMMICERCSACFVSLSK